MSRGLGRWQRAVLEELQRREAFYVREIIPAPQTRAKQLAVIRAAHQLARQGRLVVDVERQHWQRAAWGAVVVARPGVVIDRLTLAACYRLWDELSDSSGDSDPLSLSRSAPELLGTYRQSEAAERALKAATQEAKAARQAAAHAALEEAIATRVYQALRAHAEQELQEKWRRELEAAEQAFDALRQPRETTLPESREQGWSPRPTAHRGAIASLMKLLGREGPITEALIIERAQAFLGWPPEQVLLVLDQLKASGDYQRLLAEASDEA